MGKKNPPKSKSYHFIFMDIVGFAKPGISAQRQVEKINKLTEIVKNCNPFSGCDQDSLVILPTGDGMAIGFPDSPEQPFFAALEIQRKLKEYNENKNEEDKIKLRIGLNSGTVYLITDIKNERNVCGPGIIIAQRVMDFGVEGHILSSENIGLELQRLSDSYAEKIHFIGSFETKHNQSLKLYNIFDEHLGNKNTPSPSLTGKIRDSEMRAVAEKVIEEYERKISHHWKISDVTIELEINDFDTMLTHHKDTKTITCSSKDPVETIYSKIWGDTPRDFNSLNLQVYDESGSALSKDIIVDKPTWKEYLIKLREPLYMGDKLTYLEEWDWEEPEGYQYSVLAPVNGFEFLLIFPNSAEIDFKVYDSDTSTGKKNLSSIKPIHEEKNDKKIVRWSKDFLPPNSKMEFEWHFRGDDN